MKNQDPSKETIIILKNNFRYKGKFVSEDKDNLILDDYKYGEISIRKDQIIVRSIIKKDD